MWLRTELGYRVMFKCIADIFLVRQWLCDASIQARKRAASISVAALDNETIIEVSVDGLFTVHSCLRNAFLSEIQS